MNSHDPLWPVTFENCHLIRGPFYHGTKADLPVGGFLSPGHRSNFEDRALEHVYFSARLESAVWGAELAMALSNIDGRGYIYIVEPTARFEDDPNLTNKRFAGNPTRSFRTRGPLRILDRLEEWHGHSDDEVKQRLSSIQELRRLGLACIED